MGVWLRQKGMNVAAESADKVTIIVDSVSFTTGPLNLISGCLTILCMSQISTRIWISSQHLESDVNT